MPLQALMFQFNYKEVLMGVDGVGSLIHKRRKESNQKQKINLKLIFKTTAMKSKQ